MKADELMVGDIVLRKGKPVEKFSTNGIIIQIYDDKNK